MLAVIEENKGLDIIMMVHRVHSLPTTTPRLVACTASGPAGHVAVVSLLHVSQFYSQ